MSGRAEWRGSLEKSLLSMAAQKPSHSRTKLLLAMPPGMAMSLNRSLQDAVQFLPLRDISISSMTAVSHSNVGSQSCAFGQDGRKHKSGPYITQLDNRECPRVYTSRDGREGSGKPCLTAMGWT